MANIVIKKRVNLDFLGDEYKNDYLVFKAIAVSKYKDLVDGRPEEDNLQYEYVLKVLADNFIEGKFQDQDVDKKDLAEFDGETTLNCFARLTGQQPDPKV